MSHGDALVREAAAGPIDTSDRLAIIDILRGFALCGVFFSNVHVWFSGRIFLPAAKQQELMSNTANVVIDALERHLSGGKFITIFSFLFGLGLAVQFDRAEKRSQPATRFYMRRGSTMLLLAGLHLFLLWFGDILHLYALAGFVVLLFLRRTPKTILAWGIGLTLFSGSAMKLISTVFPPLFTSPVELARQATARAALVEQTNAWMLSNFAHGSLVGIIFLQAETGSRVFQDFTHRVRHPAPLR